MSTRSQGMPHMPGVLASVLLLVCGCRPGELDPVIDGERAPRRLVGAIAEFPRPFTSIRAILSLPDGRLVVSDSRENRLLVISYADGNSRDIGVIGEGPGEFRRAGGLYRGKGGGVLVFDQTLRRLLPISESGEVGRAGELVARGPAGSWSDRGPDVLSFDSLGNAYGAVRDGGFTAAVSALLRYRPDGQVDTVTWVRRATTRALEGKDGPYYQEVLFSPADAWTVIPDGRVVVVRADPYRTEWISSDGSVAHGPVIRHSPVRVTRDEKARIASGTGGPRGRFTVTRTLVPQGGQPPAGQARATPLRVEELLFARVKTPVNLRTGRWPLVDERGRLWVERSLPGQAMTKVFDVFGEAGTLVDRVELRAGVRLVGVDADWVYCARVDDDGFEYLQRYPVLP